MPPTKYNTDEERKEDHRLAALKYGRENIQKIIAYNKQRCPENKDAINARRRAADTLLRKQISKHKIKTRKNRRP